MAKGVIGVPCAELGRWSAFYACLAGLERPSDWEVVQARGSSVSANRNQIVGAALEKGAEWIFWLDDDLTFRPDVLTRLLAHQVDVVCGLSLRRHPPFQPLWFSALEGERVTWVEDLDPDERGLKRIAGCTSGGFLTHMSVFARVQAPWWTLGHIVADEWHDDVWFCRLLHEAGIAVWGDPNTHFGHMTNHEVWPHRGAEGQWNTVLARSNQAFAAMPMPLRSREPQNA